MGQASSRVPRFVFFLVSRLIYSSIASLQFSRATVTGSLLYNLYFAPFLTRRISRRATERDPVTGYQTLERRTRISGGPSPLSGLPNYKVRTLSFPSSFSVLSFIRLDTHCRIEPLFYAVACLVGQSRGSRVSLPFLRGRPIVRVYSRLTSIGLSPSTYATLGHATLTVCDMNKPGNINNEVINRYRIVSRPH